MSSYNPVQLVDGSTHTAADHNNNHNTLSGILNGNVDASNILPASLTPATMSPSANPVTFRKNAIASYVASGLIMPTSASLSATIASGVAYVNGAYLTPVASPQTVTLNSDTYVYLKDDGTYVLQTVANNAASPAATLNSDGSKALLVGIWISGATAITTVNQGSTSAVLPIASSVAYSVTDSLGNLIYPVTPNPTLIGYKQTGVPQNVATTAATDITGLAVPVIVPSGRKIRIKIFDPNCVNNGGVDNFIDWQILEGGVTLQIARNRIGAGDQRFLVAEITIAPSAGLHTYKVTTVHSSAGTMAHTSFGTSFISVELV